MNAAVSLGAIESLRSFGAKVSIDSVKSGLYNTLWPGRCEVVGKSPLIILDGAQNSASAGVLSQTVRDRFRYQRLILVLGISSDKDIRGITRQLYALADAVILTQAHTPRAANTQVLKNYFKDKEVYVAESVREAKKLALKISRKEDLILITGSLFVVGEFRNDKS
jgi:dihydrofolate synthase/folylpolyglutamate synthase